MKCYTYILRCANHSYYTGSTKNLEQRMDDHSNGRGANHTAKHPPIKLVYLEEFTRIDHAFNREKQIQKWSRAKKEALINGGVESVKRFGYVLSVKNKTGLYRGKLSISQIFYLHAKLHGADNIYFVEGVGLVLKT